jgi:hypothetical protein
MSYYEKYLKYKNKYIILQKQIGGDLVCLEGAKVKPFSELIELALNREMIMNHTNKAISWDSTSYNDFKTIYSDNSGVYLGYGINKTDTDDGNQPLVKYLALDTGKVSEFLSDATNQIPQFKEGSTSNYGDGKHINYIPSSINNLVQNASKVLILGTVDRIQPYNFHDKFIVLGSNKWSLGMNMLLIYYALHGLLPGMSLTTTEYQAKIIILIPEHNLEWKTETRYSRDATKSIRIAYEELLFIKNISEETPSLSKFKENPSNPAQKLTIEIKPVCSLIPGHPNETLNKNRITYYEVRAKY